MNYDMANGVAKGAAIFAVLVAVVAFAMGCFISHMETRAAWKDEAVKQGYAEYYLDDNANKQWRWLDVEKKP